LLRRDIASLDRILAAGFVAKNTRGEVLNRSRYLEEVEYSGVRLLSFAPAVVRVRVSGDRPS
jgi:hypothetical protein